MGFEGLELAGVTRLIACFPFCQFFWDWFFRMRIMQLVRRISKSPLLISESIKLKDGLNFLVVDYCF